MHIKTGMLFGQHFDGEPARNLNHVFLKQFENGFTKTIGMFMFKNQNDGVTWSSEQLKIAQQAFNASPADADMFSKRPPSDSGSRLLILKT